MKLLLTSAGISNKSIRNALVDLLGKPIEESKAIFVPTAILTGYVVVLEIIRKVICGTLGDPFCRSWLEIFRIVRTYGATHNEKRALGANASRDRCPACRLGGDCQYLCYWMQQSGLAEMLPSLLTQNCVCGFECRKYDHAPTRFGTTYGNHTLPMESDKMFWNC